MTNLQKLFYTEGEWKESAGHRPLADRPVNDLLLLHRHWMCANNVREAFESTLGKPGQGPDAGDAMLATSGFCFMIVWYGMLWAVIEACLDPKEGREIDLRGPFKSDIDRLSPILRPFRNAVMHVPRSGSYMDDRLSNLAKEPAAAVLIQRVHSGFGRLFLEESMRQSPITDSES